VTLTDDGPALPQEALRVVLDPFVVSRGAPTEIRHQLDGLLLHCPSSRRPHRSAKPLRCGNRIILHLPLRPGQVVATLEETDFLKKTMLNQNLWAQLMTTERGT